MISDAQRAYHATIRQDGHVFVRPFDGRGPRICSRCAKEQRLCPQGQPCDNLNSKDPQ